MKLRFRVSKPKRFYKKAYRRSQIIFGLFGKAHNQGDCGAHSMLGHASDARKRCRQIQVLIDFALYSIRSRVYSEEYAPTSGFGHQRDQLIVNAIGTGTTSPVELFARVNQCLAELDDSVAIDSEHIVNEIKVVNPVLNLDESHLLYDALRRFQTKAPAKEIIRRTE